MKMSVILFSTYRWLIFCCKICWIIVLSILLSWELCFPENFFCVVLVRISQKKNLHEIGEQGSNRSKIAQNYSLMSSSVIARICPADLAFFSFLHTAPCSSSSTAGFTDQELGRLTHRGKRFQRLLQLLIPIHFCCWVSLMFTEIYFLQSIICSLDKAYG